ncbi:aldehyde dehydrogenase [Diaphorobacter sp. LR2014-1]|uniref:aldehyde dehydrogenase n=1 Tax=Diaphorobacter sp. LR2014-1 TaxID=1933219 RepID=UPI001FF0D5B6|nr:aldehyde dehydrogenase [Diaphorobacter sp. LR2014-1]
MSQSTSLPNHEMGARSYGLHIAGEAVAAEPGRTFESFNPTTGRRWGDFAIAGADQVDRAVTAAAKAFRGPWSRMSATERGRLLMRWGDAIAENAMHIGALEATQNGKLASEMQTQARIVRDWLCYFGGMADKIEGAVIPVAQTSVLNYTLKEPLGVVAVIVPWNSPTLLMIESAAPALAAGNTIVVKPSEVTSASAIEIARLAESVGIPPGVLNVVTGLRETGEALVGHPQVRKISFIGSTDVGRAIAAEAGRKLVPCTLELGGKSPNIVFEDADIDRAEIGVLAGIFAAAGQTCVAGSRAYIHRRIYDELVSRLVRRAGRIAVGDPLAQATQMGPVASKAQLDKDQAIVREAVAAGASVLCGGERLAVPGFDGGYFFAPTILGGADAANPVICKEVFGPVLAVMPFEDDDEVLALANDSEFGLAAGVWTKDFRRAHLMARRLEAGTVWLNTYHTLAFNSPFGGYKSSGIGRVNGTEAVNHYLQTKSVWCELGDEVRDPFAFKA